MVFESPAWVPKLPIGKSSHTHKLLTCSTLTV
jgi:hypothetical protein